MYYFIVIIAILSSLIGILAVKDPETVQGITMAVFWAHVAILDPAASPRGANSVTTAHGASAEPGQPGSRLVNISLEHTCVDRNDTWIIFSPTFPI